LRGVIDSPDIPLNVSRSALTNDRTVRRIADFIAKKIGDRLKSLYSENRNEYIECWEDVGTFVKYGAIKNDKFKKQVEDLIIYRTTYEPAKTDETPKVEVQTEGDDAWQDVGSEDNIDSPTKPYTTLQEYLDRNKEIKANSVIYCSDPTTQGTYVELYKNQGLEVLFLDSFIDANYFIPFLEREHSDVKFSRVDSELDTNLVEEDKAQEIVDPKTNKTRNELIKELFEKAIAQPRVNVKTQAIKSDDPQNTPPAMVLLPEAMRRLQEMTALMQERMMGFPEDHILLINTAHPLIQNLLDLDRTSIVQGSGETSNPMVKLMCQHIYDLALMSQKAFDADGMQAFVERSNQVLTQLTNK
jgi:molecular chaperone HtpG